MSIQGQTREPLIGEPWWDVHRDDMWVTLAGGLRVPQRVVVHNLTDSEWDYYVDAEVVFDMEAVRYELTMLSIRSYRVDDRPTPITARALRSLLINKIEEKVFGNELFPLELPGARNRYPRYGLAGLEKEAEKVRGNGPVPEALELAAVIYCAVFALRGNPTQKIAQLMDLPNRTASHWVKLARERGHLSSDPTRSIDAPRGYGPWVE